MTLAFRSGLGCAPFKTNPLRLPLVTKTMVFLHASPSLGFMPRKVADQRTSCAQTRITPRGHGGYSNRTLLGKTSYTARHSPIVVHDTVYLLSQQCSLFSQIMA